MERISETVCDVLGLKWELDIKIFENITIRIDIIETLNKFLMKNNIEYRGPTNLILNGNLAYRYEILIEPWESIRELLEKNTPIDLNDINFIFYIRGKMVWGSSSLKIENGI